MMKKILFVILSCFVLISCSNVKDQEKYAQAYFENGYNLEAIEILLKLIEKDPEVGRYHALLGNVYKSNGQFDEAMVHLDLAIKYGPKAEVINAYVMRAYLYRLYSDYDKALADYSVLLKIDPKDPSYLTNQGSIFYFQGRYDKALKNFKQAERFARRKKYKKKYPGYITHYYWRWQAYLKKGNTKKSYEAMHELNPARTHILALLQLSADDYFSVNNPEKAYALLTQADYLRRYGSYPPPKEDMRKKWLSM